MPSLYTTLLEFQDSSIGQAISAFWPEDDVLTWQLMESSEKADRHCDRIFGKNLSDGSVTLSVQANVNDTFISVNNVLGIHTRDAVALTGGTTEVLTVTGAEVTSLSETTSGMLPGRVYLSSPVTSTHSISTPCLVYRQEQFTNGGKEIRRYDYNTRLNMGKIRVMDKPILAQDASSRRIPIRQYPLWSAYQVLYTFPTTGTEATLSNTGIILDVDEGFMRLPDTTANPQGTVWRIQYNAGYAVIPRTIRQAVHYFAAGSIMRGENPIGGDMYKVDDTEVTKTASMYEAEGARLLAPFVRGDATPSNETP